MKKTEKANQISSNKKTVVLITGGAGYIGTNIVVKLIEADVKIVVVDNFSNSYKKNIFKLMSLNRGKIKLYNFDLLDTKKLNEVIKKEQIDAVIHLAGKKYVQESFERTEEYYKNNVVLTKKLLSVLTKNNIKKLVFASSITVYGSPKTEVISETHALKPVSPYAKQKAQCEKLIKNWQQKTGSDVVVMRQSNPLGANLKLLIGDTPKTKKYKGVLPYMIDNVKNGKKLVFNKTSKPTKDGTSIRDYIHVEDVASTFAFAVQNFPKGFNVFNIGSGEPGSSVLDIKREVENALSTKVEHSFREAKKGDASVMLTDNNLAKKCLNLKITKSLKDMVQSQIDCEKNI